MRRPDRTRNEGPNRLDDAEVEGLYVGRGEGYDGRELVRVVGRKGARPKGREAGR